MWFDSQRTKDIAAMLDMVEVGANNGWMQPATGRYFNQCLERDEKAITLLNVRIGKLADAARAAGNEAEAVRLERKLVKL